MRLAAQRCQAPAAPQFQKGKKSAGRESTVSEVLGSSITA